ncbi:Ca-activated chloride channel family protein [Murinocardiopsis flavida]|uniref:Ca-activated chloride channel family protein n=1 Tax=Murinocardiopsis flavida TaxID=645275 RepID=A0A2P8DMM7_9ACTN|nr:VWA domain-containing protein [Murinocardiopsis flavida]PSK98473.1 Ca-activated chloride channel family protein [Murinocardiopsis flavida]
MSFLEPIWLWLLAAAPVLLAGYIAAQRRRSRYAVRFATLPMLERLAPARPGWRRHLPAAALLTALVALALAVARPVAEVTVPRERATVVVALDTSESMRAEDVEPSRIEVAKEAATRFVEGLPQRFNVGLVAFSGTASVEAAPSTDHREAIDRIAELRLDQSTAIGDAVTTSLQSIADLDDRAADDPPPARIVLLSDGANTSGVPLGQAAEAAAEAGVPVSTIAYGTPEGRIELGGRSTPVPVDAESLEDLARDTGGGFHTAQSDAELRQVYEDLESSIGWTVEEREITTLVVGAAMAALVAAGLGSLIWFARLP